MNGLLSSDTDCIGELTLSYADKKVSKEAARGSAPLTPARVTHLIRISADSGSNKRAYYERSVDRI